MFLILDKNVTENKIPDTLIAKGVLSLFFVKKSPGVISGLPFTGCQMLFSIDFPYEGHIYSHGAGARSLCPCMASAGLNGQV